MKPVRNETKLYFLIALLITTAALISVLLLVCPLDQIRASYDVTQINDVAQTAAENWDAFISGRLQGREEEILPECVYDYAIITTDNELIYATSSDIPVNTIDAAAAGCINYPVRSFDNADATELLGYMIVPPVNAEVYVKAAASYRLSVVIVMLAVAIILSGIVFYIASRILKPFGKLRDFADEVAHGNLDKPLEMNKGNYFGAFTESFDMMRNELKRSKEREDKLIQSRRDMVAQLSHDIKTPVASIIATSEVLKAKLSDKASDKLDVIIEKATQLAALSDELNGITKNEIDKLTVDCETVSSDELQEMIKTADYNGLIKDFELPDALVLIDRSRMKQVIDNVISNSYKYAGTEIEINASISSEFLIVRIKDKGPGVKNEELKNICDKYVRGSEAGDKEGAGLGLYTARQLMTAMNGDFQVNSEYGEYFEVMLVIAMDI
ncbi:MAG: HAMP domain-containing histidine kinase [Lachnospiraceae bacterium]|nr:HAMP domain-containing histidine kinase [Lachnospiraceae bacterium]